MPRYKIHDKENGILQFDDEAASADEAWQSFMAILGYQEEEKGVCERSAYIIKEEPN